MVYKDTEADNGQALGAEATITMFAEDEPPKGQWATYEVIKNGELVESFKIPFTKAELDLIIFLREKERHPDLVKGYADGGPERQHMPALRIPHGHGLDDRGRAIEMLRKIARAADKIVRYGKFTSGLNAREAVAAIRHALEPLIPPEGSS